MLLSLVAQEAPEKPEAPENPAAAPEAPPVGGDLTASELYERAREVFAAGDYKQAEALFERLDREYGENEVVDQAIAENRPLLALCKVQLKKFDEAGVLIDESLAQPGIDRRVRGELSFWRGICHMQAKGYAEAQHALGSFYKDPLNDSLKRREALVLFGACYMLAGQGEAAAEFFAAQIPRLREEVGGAEVAGRAVILQLYSLMGGRRHEEALELVRTYFPRLDEITQVASFQLITLELGSHFLEKKKYHEAIACLQRIWERKRLVGHQREKLAMLEAQRTILKARPERRAALFSIEGMVTRVKRELENLGKIEDFDAALRLRLATAYQGLGRSREAALVLEDMLRRLEPNAIVEGATVALTQNWMEIERWPKAVESADLYIERFGDREGGVNVPQVLFLKAQAYQGNLEFEEAAKVYMQIATDFPDSDIAPKAQFMNGFVMLLQDRYEDALEVFTRFADEYPEAGRLIEDSDYWQGMTFSLLQKYEEAREHMGAYLERFGEKARYRVEATFRIAFSTHAIADYPGAIEAFEKFVKAHGKDPLADEALLLLGDALLGEGESDRGIATYKRIRPEATRFFEDGWFKIGKALRLLEDLEGMEAHFGEFIASYPESHRLPEAIYWIGWTHQTAGEPEKAKALYWETLREHGDDPERHSMSELFLALGKLYAGDKGRAELVVELKELSEAAVAEERETLALRAIWAQAQSISAENEKTARGLLLEASKLVDPIEHNPRLVADCADALRVTGNLLQAEELYDEMRRWHPRAVERDRAYAGLGFIAREQGDDESAILYFDKFERTTFGSPLLGEILLSKAALHAESGQRDLAMETLEKLLENEVLSSRHKGLALMDFGSLWKESENYRKAAAYYERVYVSYGKHRDLVAKAYLERGRALEVLEMKEKALSVYKELAAREDLEAFEEARRVRGDIARLELEGVGEPVVKEEATEAKEEMP